ncbi:hypothetical protein KR018_008653 [Drosophila ironensis]|nr:hypothetical protein KR018_008653 [Drosophila ironensis]
MSSGKSKKTTKDQIPKPISVKKEKVEDDRQLHALSHYIDDRLELVKQIFGTLKPKTILNLAPEFLKKTPLDEIEELCLEELLCLSTKRLKSIIDGTRCPTDTESSEDSDVEHKEEHISLEEISSDSDIGGQESRRAKKKLKSKKANNGSDNKEGGGQMSVLELLELQARARAIRSQLAMEPITKIEVKSDDDDENPAEQKKPKQKEKRSSKNSETGKRKSQELPKVNKKTQEDEAPRKKIKIKRTYRQTTKSPEKEAAKEASLPSAATSGDANKRDIRSKSRSASPDVIPIQTETVTLYISDSTDDESTNKDKPKEASIPVAAPIPVPAEPPAPVVESEPEEGEVRDEPEEVAKPPEPTKPEEPPKNDEPKETSEPQKPEVTENSEETEATSDANNPPEEPKEPVPDPPAAETSEQAAQDDEDQNDDVISIGGDLEMIEEMTKEDEPATSAGVKSEKSIKADTEELDNDVISLDTSEDERDKLQDTESWRTRYLKSSKVSQVLAASRLGKRVRDKIKKSKHSKDGVSGGDQDKNAKQEVVFTSKHEDGSVEQYQELLQHRQRRTSSSNKADK